MVYGPAQSSHPCRYNINLCHENFFGSKKFKINTSTLNNSKYFLNLPIYTFHPTFQCNFQCNFNPQLLNNMNKELNTSIVSFRNHWQLLSLSRWQESMQVTGCMYHWIMNSPSRTVNSFMPIILQRTILYHFVSSNLYLHAMGM